MLRKIALATGSALALALAACSDSGSGAAVTTDGFVSPEFVAAQRADYLAFETAEFLPGNVNNAIAHMERSLTDDGYTAPSGVVDVAAWAPIFAKIESLADTSDFDVLRLLTALHGYRGHPYLTESAWRAVEETVLGFKYWFGQPTPAGVIDDMWYWTENHLVTFHVCELLAGQMFPDEVFTTTGMTGREHMAHARERLLTWFDLRARFGFSEWLSNVYYTQNLRSLITLVEFADDAELVRLGEMTLDLLVYDLALHTFRGSLGGSHGRTYKKDKMSALDQDTYNIVKFLFDESEEDYTGRGETTVTMFARAHNYRMPQVFLDIATTRAPYVARQRMGIVFDEHAPISVDPQHPYGFGFESEDDLVLWWSMSNLTAWQVVPATLDLINRLNLWDTQGFADFASIRDLTAVPEIAQTVALNLAHAASMALLSEVNLQTFRTADYMLTSAIDYRKGSRSNQGHFWQATLGTDALVFTTHPGHGPRETLDWRDDGQPGQWTGTASIPRAGQHANVGIYIYAPQYRANPSPPFNLVTNYEPYTHAYFPQDAFDVVTRDGHWTFAAKGDGYVALYSYREPEFIAYDPSRIATRGMQQPFELRAAGGPNNVWIVELGDRETWGSFDAFRAAILAAPVAVTPVTDPAPLPPRTLGPVFDVSYESPSQGKLEFGWAGPLRVDGEDVAVDDYARYDHPWGFDDFQSNRNEVRTESGSLILDFPARERIVAAGD